MPGIRLGLGLGQGLYSVYCDHRDHYCDLRVQATVTSGGKGWGYRARARAEA